MKKLIAAAVLAATFFAATLAHAATATNTRGGFIDKFVLTDTVNPAFEGYIIIVVAGAEHKIVYQKSASDHETFTDYCNVNDEEDRFCDPFNPGPVYTEWDAATQVVGGDLTPANRRKWLYAWTYQEHIRKALKSVQVYLENQSGFTENKQRSYYSGAMQAWGVAPVDADACATDTIGLTGVCTYTETGLSHLTARIKRLTEDLFKAVIDLP